MQHIKTGIAVYCFACIASGLSGRFVTEESSRKCIKIFSALYILLAVLECFAGIPQAFTGSFSVSAPVGSEPERQMDFQQQVLDQAVPSLCRQCESALKNLGIEAEISLTLDTQENAVSVAYICAKCRRSLTPEEKKQAQDVLCAMLSPGKIEVRGAEA